LCFYLSAFIGVYRRPKRLSVWAGNQLRTLFPRGGQEGNTWSLSPEKSRTSSHPKIMETPDDEKAWTRGFQRRASVWRPRSIVWVVLAILIADSWRIIVDVRQLRPTLPRHQGPWIKHSVRNVCASQPVGHL
jgi:hypothetical protein